MFTFIDDEPTSPPVTAPPTTLPPTGVPSPSPTAAPTTKNPTLRPTSSPSSSPTVTESNYPTLSPNTIRTYIENVAIDGGTEFFFPQSYQSLALSWVLGQTFPIPELPLLTIEEQAIQLYSLTCLYFSTFAVPNGVEIPGYTDNSLPGWRIFLNWLVSPNVCSWYGVECDSNGRVEKIDLYQNMLSGSIPPEVEYLSGSLTELNLSGNFIRNVGADQFTFLGKLTNLKRLNLGSTYLQYDGVPDELGKLTNLEELDISYTLFWGDLSRNSELWSNLSNLEYLHIGGNSFNGPLPQELVTMPKLQFLYAEYSDLTGNLNFIADMPAIKELWIDHNPLINEVLPASLGNQQTIESLSFTYCSIGGTIPGEIGNMLSLERIWMSFNKLTGNVPGTLASARLSEIYLVGNDLTGSMPDDICQKVFPLGRILELAADCEEPQPEVTCPCCTCCGESCGA